MLAGISKSTIQSENSFIYDTRFGKTLWLLCVTWGSKQPKQNKKKTLSLAKTLDTFV